MKPLHSFFSTTKEIGLLTLIAVVLLGSNYASGQWSNAPSNPPASNTDVPINTGTAGQIKNGDLTLANTYPWLELLESDSLGSRLVNSGGNFFIQQNSGTNATPIWNSNFVLRQQSTGANYARFEDQVRAPQYCDENGSNCIDASSGMTGPAGATGPRGATGSDGPRGSTGATGSRGATGATGPQGSTGPAGPAASRIPTGNPPSNSLFIGNTDFGNNSNTSVRTETIPASSVPRIVQATGYSQFSQLSFSNTGLEREVRTTGGLIGFLPANTTATITGSAGGSSGASFQVVAYPIAW